MWVEKCDEVGGLPTKFQSYPLGEASRKIMLNFNLEGNFEIFHIFHLKNHAQLQFTKDFPLIQEVRDFRSEQSESCPNQVSTRARRASKAHQAI